MDRFLFCLQGMLVTRASPGAKALGQFLDGAIMA
jgi:hypothetical protein